MTRDEITKLVYASFYTVVRIHALPPVKQFENMTLVDSLGGNVPPDPAGWVDFWWEVLARKIDSDVKAAGEYILDFDTDILKSFKKKRWAEAITYIKSKLTK